MLHFQMSFGFESDGAWFLLEYIMAIADIIYTGKQGGNGE